MTTIAFIGLGNMGAPMAMNLLKAGHKVCAFDVNPAALAVAEKHGAAACASIAETIDGADAVVTMLPSGAHSREVYDVVIPLARSGAVLMDCSTIDIQTARAVIAQAEQRGLLMVDAPVSGGVGGAESAALTFMVGGTDDAFAAAKPYLACMGKTLIHTGPAGTGQAAKLCNNMLLGISMIGVSEAFRLAQNLGLDAKVLFDVSSKSSGQCWSMTSYCPVPGLVEAAPSNRDYKPGFSAAMMLKDLKLSQDAASATSARTPLGAVATKLYDQFVSGGGGAVDFSAIIRAL